jgi:hypothetical protein
VPLLSIFATPVPSHPLCDPLRVGRPTGALLVLFSESAVRAVAVKPLAGRTQLRPTVVGTATHRHRGMGYVASSLASRPLQRSLGGVHSVGPCRRPLTHCVDH